jgi:hypothetical protein
VKVGELVIYWDGFTGLISKINGDLVEALALDGSGYEWLCKKDCEILTEERIKNKKVVDSTEVVNNYEQTRSKG